jgi:hypothetical protein
MGGHIVRSPSEWKATPGTCENCIGADSRLATMGKRVSGGCQSFGGGGTVLGFLSMNDVVLAAGAGKEVASEDVVQTLGAICARHHPVPHVVAA